MLPGGGAGSLVASVGSGSAGSLSGEGGLAPGLDSGLPRPQDHLPYTNTRLVLRSEVEDEDSYFFGGTVVRLWSSATSHPAVRGNLQGLEARRVSLGALAVQAVVNMRGPDGIVGVIPGEEKHSARLLGLCRDCHERGEVLACTLPSADMVLVPRLPDTAAQDGLYFLAYATNLRAVELCDRLRAQSRVALVLDLDNTLVDAVSASIAPGDWGLLDWRYVLVTNSYGRQIQAQYAPLPGGDPWSDELWVMHWKVGRINCTFKVRVRRGWAELRAFLAQNAHRFAVFVCSKGKREYIQLLWLMLDPAGELIPESDWGARLTSTFPDTLAQAANKSALTALGCYDVTKPHVPTQVALPMLCLDDSMEAYEPEYEHCVMYCAEYRPSDLLEADDGNVLRQARSRLEAFWSATCTSDGSFAWQAAQSFAMALMKTMQRNPMSSPDDLSFLQVRCAKQGAALWHQFTVRGVFGEAGCFLADDPGRDRLPAAADAAALPAPAAAQHCATCQLPVCKPGCPGTAAGGATSSVPVPAPPQRLGAVEAALSEGRSSEDSVLLGMPSPTYSVLPPSGAAASASMDDASGGSSPTAEPRLKQQRLGAWEGGGEPSGAATGWDALQQQPQRGAQAAAAEAALAPAGGPASLDLEAALAGVGRSLMMAEDDSACSAAPPSRQPPLPELPQPRAHLAPWERLPAAPKPAGPQAAAGPGGGAGGANPLAAALAAISRGLMEDGLL